MRRLPLLLVILTALAVPHAATAATIIFFNENRQLNANSVQQFYGESGLWSSSVSSTHPEGGSSFASQTTTISNGFIGGVGLAEIDFSSDFARALIQTEFVIDAPFLAQLDVDFFQAGLGINRAFLGSRDAPFPRIWDFFGEQGLTSISVEGVLAPGRYTFWLESGSTTPFNAILSFDGGLTLSPVGETEVVPEPASMTLLGIGLLAAGARRLRRRPQP